MQKYSSSTDALSRMEGGGGTTSSSSGNGVLSSSSTPVTTPSQQQQQQLQTDIALYQSEIPTLLATLQEMILKKLSVTAVTPSQRAVTTRYEQVFRETKLDYDRIQQQYNRYSERNELFSNHQNNNNNSNATPGSDPAMEALLRERNSVANSIHHTSNILSQADAIRNDLHHQGRSLRNTNSVVARLTQHFPSINSLVDTIRRRRNSDDTIVAIVVALCIVFTFWYVFG